MLNCPIDGLILECDNNSLKCAHGHSYDKAKQGYINLLTVQNKRSKSPGDSKEMVAARQSFLASNIYKPISEKINQIALSHTETLATNILDAGCGEGYYLAQLEQAAKKEELETNLLGLDISKFAIQAAAKKSKNIQWLVASNRQIPIADQSLDLILCIFGFPVFSEFKQKLTTNGKILLVESAENHLIELRELIYPEIKPYQQNNYQEALDLGLTWGKSDTLSYQVELNKEQLAELLIMTPHIHRANRDKLEQVKKLDKLALTINVNFRLLQIK